METAIAGCTSNKKALSTYNKAAEIMQNFYIKRSAVQGLFI